MDASASILENRAFQIESARSEYTRIRWMIGVIAGLVVLTVVRSLVFYSEESAGRIAVALVMGAIIILYEALLGVIVRRYVQRREGLPEVVWRISTVVEACLPSAALALGMADAAVGPHQALSRPVLVGQYHIMILLSTMRLRPALCLVSGAATAAGYLGLVAVAFSIEAPPEGRSDWAAPFVTGTLFLLTGGIAAAVAAACRGYLMAALHEAAERQRAQLHSRNTLIFGLAKLAEYRDTDTGAHLERIAAYSAVLAEALRPRFPEINTDWIDTIRVASSMHDIGKVGIPDGVLLKPGKPTPEERQVIERHPGLGRNALQAILDRHGEDSLLRMSAEIALDHHEHWDGAGYPGHRAGTNIALAARIISVADVYDALTSRRVYKPALSHEESCRMIREGRGTQFDPDVVDAFVGVTDKFDALRRQHAEPAPSPS